MKAFMKVAVLMTFLFSFIAFPLFQCSADAAHVVGIIKKIKGKSIIVRKGLKRPAAKGSKLLVNDIVLTSSNGAVGIILRDNSVVAIGKNSRFYVKDFQFNPHENKASVVARIEKGAMTYLSGMAAKMNKDAVKIETPHYVTCAVRGTKTAITVTPDWTEKETIWDE